MMEMTIKRRVEGEDLGVMEYRDQSWRVYQANGLLAGDGARTVRLFVPMAGGTTAGGIYVVEQGPFENRRSLGPVLIEMGGCRTSWDVPAVVSYADRLPLVLRIRKCRALPFGLAASWGPDWTWAPGHLEVLEPGQRRSFSSDGPGDYSTRSFETLALLSVAVVAVLLIAIALLSYG